MQPTPSADAIHPGIVIKKRLQELGKQQRWLVRQMAELGVPITDGAISLWIRTGEIAAKHIAVVAQALGITTDELLCVAKPKRRSGTHEIGGDYDLPEGVMVAWITWEENAILQRFRMATEAGQDSIRIAAKSAPTRPPQLVAPLPDAALEHLQD